MYKTLSLDREDLLAHIDVGPLLLNLRPGRLNGPCKSLLTPVLHLEYGSVLRSDGSATRSLYTVQISEAQAHAFLKPAEGLCRGVSKEACYLSQEELQQDDPNVSPERA